MKHVGVIGAGVMGEALIAALISYGVSPESIVISEKRKDRADELTTRYSIVSQELVANVAAADAILLVVKPQDMASVLDEIKSSINNQALVITFAAGKKISFIEQGLGTENPVVRVMPNTPTLVGAGMAAVSLGALCSPKSDFIFIDQHDNTIRFCISRSGFASHWHVERFCRQCRRQGHHCRGW